MSNPAEDARDKLLLLTAALFAVRLFRGLVDNPANRDAAAESSALDAAAIMAAVDKVNL